MKIRTLFTLILIVGLAVLVHDDRVALSATPGPDFPVPGGHFYTQANGTANPSQGFTISDTGGVPFRSAFEELGGVPGLGYPSSQRFTLDGFVTQATQKALLQWRPDERDVAFVNVFDLLHQRGLDSWLLSNKQIPPESDTSADTGLGMDQVLNRHLAILDISPEIRSLYLADPDPIAHFGLPMSSADLGTVIVVRAQRAAFQFWKVDMPWAKAGEVTIANGGDLAKEAGLVPVEAAVPEQAPASTTMTAPEIFAKASPAVVKVTLPTAQGSGIIFDPQGYILTNNHVIEDGGPIHVSTPKGELPARVVGADPMTDLAVLKVDQPDLPSLTFGNSDLLRPGEEVFAIGYTPFVPNPPSEYVAQVLNLVGSPLRSTARKADFVQTNATLHPGDSGGPLLNMFGEVVGVNTALIFPRRGGQRVLASSIAIDRAEPVIQELITNGKISRPSLGLTVHVITPGISDDPIPVDHGLLVISVAPGSPGEKAGISNGDVILEADGAELLFASDLQSVLSNHKIGDAITMLVVDEDGTIRQVTATLAE